MISFLAADFYWEMYPWTENCIRKNVYVVFFKWLIIPLTFNTHCVWFLFLINSFTTKGMISFAVSKIKCIFHIMQYFNAVMTQKKTSQGFYWVGSTGKSGSSSLSGFPGRRVSSHSSESDRARWHFILITAEKESKNVLNIPLGAVFWWQGEISSWLVSETGGTCCQLLAVTCCWVLWINSGWAWGLFLGFTDWCSLNRMGSSRVAPQINAVWS